MENLKPYDQERFEAEFKKTQQFALLSQRHSKIIFDKFFEQGHVKHWFTPRQYQAESFASAVPFYYLQYLDQTVQIVDLGCGMNFFKPYFANVHGIGMETGLARFSDEVCFIDQQFFEHRAGTLNSVLSINALHYCALENIQSVCKDFIKLLRPGGRGFLALNLIRMLEQSAIFDDASTEQIDKFIRRKLSNLSSHTVVFDLDLSVRDAVMDGNIRIVFER